MNVVALEILAEQMEALASDAHAHCTFDLGSWGSDEIVEGQCHTTACAMGWATTNPKLRRLGLRRCDEFSHGGEAIRGKRKGHRDLMPAIADEAGILTGLRAAVWFFGITDQQASSLFLPEQYAAGHREAADVAKRIRQMIAHYQAGEREWYQTPAEHEAQLFEEAQVAVEARASDPVADASLLASIIASPPEDAVVLSDILEIVPVVAAN